MWAYLERFTHLVDYDAKEPILPDVMTLEAELLKSSPSTSSNSGHKPSEVIVEVIETLIKPLYKIDALTIFYGHKPWFRFLRNFVDKALSMEV